MSDLVRTEPLVHPLTGQVLDIDNATVADLGRMLADVREHESLLRELKRYVSSEVLRRMDASAEWTAYAAGLKLTGTSPAPVEEFDGAELRAALLELADEGVISQDAVDKAVETVVTYKARKGGINALRKLQGRVKATIDAHAVETSRERYVRVERAV